MRLGLRCCSSRSLVLLAEKETGQLARPRQDRLSRDDLDGLKTVTVDRALTRAQGFPGQVNLTSDGAKVGLSKGSLATGRARSADREATAMDFSRFNWGD
jgi:hypothetical protein